MRRAGVQDNVIMKMTGHKTLAMFTRYDTVDPQDAQEALKQLDRLLGGEENSASKLEGGQKERV